MRGSMSTFWERRRERWRKWWATPFKWWEHALVCVAAVLYCGLIGSVAAILVGGVPLFPLDQLAFRVLAWATSVGLLGGVFAYFFPKVAFCIMYPLSFIGFGEVEVG